MKNRKHFWLILLLIALLLSGCGKDTHAAVRTLSCVQPGNMPTLLKAGESGLLTVWQEGRSTRLVLVNTDRDCITSQTELSGSWMLLGETFDDGAFALYEWNSLSWRFFDSELAELGSFCCDDVSGVFSHDRSRYYRILDGFLCCTDVKSGLTETVELPQTLYYADICGISPGSDIIALHFELSPFAGGCGTAVIDLKDKEFLCLSRENYLPHFTENGMALRRFDEAAMAYDISYGIEAPFYFADAGLFSVGGSELFGVEGTDCLIGCGGGKGTILYRLRDRVSASTLPDYGLSGDMRTACRLGSSGLIAGAVYSGTAFQIVLIDPERLEYTDIGETELIPSPLTVDSSCAEEYRLALDGAPLPEELSAQRSHADRLEEKYGVSIYLSSQCAPFEGIFTHDFATTDTMSRSEEAADIERVLSSLDETLALYPEGFFRQFRGAMNNGGIRFLITGAIESDCGIIGETVEHRGWQNIIMDAGQEFFAGIICHELWHAMENKIVSEDMYAFDIDVWAAYNPDGFAYYYDTSQTDPEAARWTLYRTGGEELHFVDAYARQNEHEDRARLMEYMMTVDYFIPDLIGSEFTDGKLQIMFAAIREHFTIDGGDAPLWEQNYSKFKEHNHENN